MKKVGIIIFLLGLTLTVYTSILYFTKEKVVQIEKDEISNDKPNRTKWSTPVTGIAIMGIGGILFWQTYNEQ